jgi:NADP-dependent 3-hydroxy acid dehydrogenase YdfG
MPDEAGENMPVSLKDKVLVVGASSGIGRATAIQFAREGARVMAAARREERLNDLRSEVLGAGGTIEICATDALDQAQVERLVAATEKSLDGNMLVYAAGTNVPN